MNEELTVEELFEYGNDQEKATLNWLIAKHDAACRSKPEKRECSHCSKKFWGGSAMKAHKEATGHYATSERLALFYDKMFMRDYVPIAKLNAPLAVSLCKESDLGKPIKFNGEEANG